MPWPSAAAKAAFHATIDSQGLTVPEADTLHAPAEAIPVAPQQAVIVCEGDSLTQGTGTPPGSPYPTHLLNHLGTSYAVSNLGAGGDRLAQMIAQGAAADSLYNASAPKNAFVAWGGTNDLYDGRTGAAAYTDFVSYCQARRAAGWKVVAVPILARNQVGLPAGFETERQSFNASLRANWRTFADALCDIDGDQRFSDPLNTTYFPDGVHLTDAGYAIVSDYVGASILGMYP